MIHISQSAIEEVLRLRSKHAKPDAFLRLGIQSSCCSSFSYALDFAESAQSDDQVFTSGDLQIVVDAQALKYLDGLTLDYSEDLMGGGFRYHNPNAAQTCGCGNSFTLKEEQIPSGQVTASGIS